LACTAATIWRMNDATATMTIVRKPTNTIISGRLTRTPMRTISWKFSACAAWNRMNGPRSLHTR
jgi:hypothetical protein